MDSSTPKQSSFGSMNPSDYSNFRAMFSNSTKESITDIIHKITKETDDLPLKGNRE